MIDSTLLINKQLEYAKVMCGTSDYTDALLFILSNMLSSEHARQHIRHVEKELINLGCIPENMLGRVTSMAVNELMDQHDMLHEFKDSVLLTIREERPDLEQEVNSMMGYGLKRWIC